MTNSCGQEKAFDRRQWQEGFDLLCLCLNEQVDDRDVIDAISRVTRWDLFLQQMGWHRVMTLVWQRLSALHSYLPEAVATSLKDGTRTVALKALNHARELSRICQCFEKVRVDFLVLKGLPLSCILYGNLGTRFSRDIDILIRNVDVARVHEELLAMGYERIIPRAEFSDASSRYYDRFYKDFIYRNNSTGVTLELHWRLTENPYLLSTDKFDPFQHCTVCQVSGIGMPVMEAEYNALYIIVHAAKSHWARLSWLSDVAGLMQQPLDWCRIHDLARENGISDIVWVSIQTAHRLLGAPLPGVFSESVYKPSIPGRVLLMWALNTLKESCYPGELACRFQYLLFSRRLRFVSHHVVYRMALSLNDVALFALPRRLFFLYIFMRPVLWAWRRILPQYKDQVGFQR